MAGRRSKLTLFRLGNPLSSTSWILTLEGIFRQYSSFNISFPWVNLYRSGAARSPAGSRMFVNSRGDSLPCFGDSKLPLKFSSCSFSGVFSWFQWQLLSWVQIFSEIFLSWSMWLVEGCLKTQILWMFYPWDPHTPLQHLSPKVCSQGDQEVVGWLSWRPLFQALLFIEEAFLEWPDKPR